jgi:hypothetical protein
MVFPLKSPAASARPQGEMSTALFEMREGEAAG